MRSLCVAFLMLALGVPSAAASGTIRVAIVENARVAELRGTNIEVSELGCPGCAPRPAWPA